MVDVNRITTPANMHWSFVDRETGAANHAIDWRFRVGDQVKLRLVNEMDSDHPMHHPFHIHGAGRFVVLARDGASRGEPGLERHRAGANRRDRRHPSRRDEPGHLDGALPHRRASRERNDVQLQRGASGRRLNRYALVLEFLGTFREEVPASELRHGVAGTRDSGQGDSDDVRRDAGSAGVAADGGHRGVSRHTFRQPERRVPSRSSSWLTLVGDGADERIAWSSQLMVARLPR